MLTSRVTAVLTRRIRPRPTPLHLSCRANASVREKSTSILSDDNTIEAKIISTAFNNNVTKNPLPDFNDARITYEDKSTTELLRAAGCFRLCQVPFLVNYAESMLWLGRKIVGGRIVDMILKATLYGHFCAGEDQERIRPVLQSLANAGVGSILDYAAENDSGDGETTEGAELNITAREYDYESEAKCDKHTATFIKCIKDVGALNPNHDGYAAVKVTALGNPKLLARLSTAIVEAKRLFEVFDLDGDGLLSRKEFEVGYNRYFADGDTRIKKIFEKFDPLQTGYIDYITWSMMLQPQDLPKICKRCNTAGRLSDACPTDEEIELLNAMYDRGRLLGEEAAKSGVRLLIDAEQKRYQPAIDNLVLELQREFNGSDKPIIYNTYQCYLVDSPERLKNDVERSERFNYHFGAKLVRGAYMESERELAEAVGDPDPIHPTIEKTHECYNNSVAYLLRHSAKSDLNVEIMCATHNDESITKAIESMNDYGIDRTSSTLCFAQLYGMSDALTFNLGKYGYRAFKYVPYGEVDEVMPYLLRRARENSAIVGATTFELEMIKAELGRRFKGGQVSKQVQS